MGGVLYIDLLAAGFAGTPLNHDVELAVSSLLAMIWL